MLTKFIEQRLEQSPNNRVGAKQVYLSYKKFAKNYNSIPLKYREFRDALIETKGEGEIRCILFRNIYFFENIALREQTIDESGLINIAKAYYHLK